MERSYVRAQGNQAARVAARQLTNAARLIGRRSAVCRPIARGTPARIISELEKIKVPATHAASANKQIIQELPPIQMSTDTVPWRAECEVEAKPSAARANRRPPMCLFAEMFIERDACSCGKYLFYKIYLWFVFSNLICSEPTWRT